MIRESAGGRAHQADVFCASFLFGMGVGTSLPLWSYSTARVFGAANVGRVVGLMTMITLPFALLARPAMGLTFDRTGAYDAASCCTSA